MGFLSNAFQKLQAEAEKALVAKLNINDNGGNAREKSSSSTTTSSTKNLTMSEILHYESDATRWEKTVVATNFIMEEVAKSDPDGVDVVCVGGSGGGDDNGVEWHRNLHDAEGLEETIASKDPSGPCMLGNALENVLNEALEEKDLSKIPCSVLVLTAGGPDDPEVLEEALKSAAQKVSDRGGVKACPLSVTFVQIGSDETASEYLKYLDEKMVGVCDETGKTIDIVDTLDMIELKQSIDNMNSYTDQAEREKNNGTNGAILGAMAGAAIGIGGMYLYGQQKAKKRVKSGSWGGQWKCFYGEEFITTLTVGDDGEGNLTIDGLEETMSGSYLRDEDGAVVDDEDLFFEFREPDGELVKGSFDAEHFFLNWTDGTRWEALNPPTGWAGYTGAAVAGAAAVGSAGFAIDKKFFKKVSSEDDCDYVVVVDRSEAMGMAD
mmetsp:Transcript_24028/g.51091  ORF Transcript_24028/g.51091 Transcript_24028/m.51091 type:complete len:436 (+) Transcript_24028:112-1419(+)|eukprot:CAMPEP_0201115968 /NCGR_PEP_ID=MMETSP0850-20130426/358_1 /ASSEMBLY_ACC=CAM_ASM_000622 /TAXON_ID=183588 /ORGANISM="Pseudo-nitzschia fraudulenta, Strain WWA7" /LENGTH=435 /DNA_ID=CAMNT_0047379907 /DNA_START=117 /DNA_END=1424 /DNA_ORIENTATION=+